MKINDILFEFAPPGSGDSGDDGFSEETLKRLAAQWYNGDEDPRVERTLMAAGWEIGQDEGYDDEPGVFVVQSGDVNGNSYLSWPAHELKQGVAEGFLDKAKDAIGWLQDLRGQVPSRSDMLNNRAPALLKPTQNPKELTQQDTSSDNSSAEAFSKEILNRLNKLKEDAKTELSKLEDIPRHQLTIKNEKRITELEKILNIEMSAKGLQYLFNIMVKSAPNLQSKWAIWKMMGADLSPEALKFLGNLDAGQLFADIYRGNWQNNKDQGVAEGMLETYYDRGDYYDAKMGGEYGRDLPQTDNRRNSGMSDKHERGGRNDVFKGQSKNLPADPFARTTGVVPKAGTGKIYTTAMPDEVDESKPKEKEADYGPEYQDMVARVKKLAGMGPLKTVYDPQKRVYKNVPTAVQPKK